MTPSTPASTDAGALAGISIDVLRKRLVTKMLASDEDALPFDDYGPETQQHYLRMADAVIEAIQNAEYRELPSLNDSRNCAPQETRGDEPVGDQIAGDALLAAPQQSPRLEREGIAREVDPHAFKSWQGLYDYCLKDGETAEFAKRCADSFHGEAINSALIRADAILALLSPDTTVVSSTSHREVYTPGVVSNREPIAGPINFIWPAGCQSPNSCHRNGRCMYVGCKHDGKDIRILAQLVPSNHPREVGK